MEMNQSNSRWSRSTPASTLKKGSLVGISVYGVAESSIQRHEGRALTHKHLDFFHRRFERDSGDEARYLDPVDGKLRKLYVQTTDSLYRRNESTTWRQKRVKNVSPWMLRLAYWPWTLVPLVPEISVNSSADHTLGAKFRAMRRAWSAGDWSRFMLSWIPACGGLLVLMLVPTSVGGETRNNGCYDPVPYRFWCYPREARNFHENFGSKPSILMQRTIEPRYLCFLDKVSDANPLGILTPDEWRLQRDDGAQPTYVFISYTGPGQFERQCSAEQIAQMRERGESHHNCVKCRAAPSDAAALHRIARMAAGQAGVTAYWTDKCCMSGDAREFSEDVNRISDVARAAKRIVCIVGRSGFENLPNGVDTLTLLREHGSRMWTWPEILLGPKEEPIHVWTRDTRQRTPIQFSKLSFAERVWADADIARQVVDHFEGTLTLSRLELVVLALDALKCRETKEFLPGDLSYALMGLLRQRPKVDTENKDTAFQAFARLSLANDSDRLLERLCCVLPVLASNAPRLTLDRKQNWTNMEDHWGAKLWDIEPYIQVAGVADYDTVILDGAYGAAVTWDSFQRVAVTTRATWTRIFARLLVRSTPLWLLAGIIICSVTKFDSTNYEYGNVSGHYINMGSLAGIIILLIGIVLTLLSPKLILHMYGGKVWNAQPWLFGFEGRLTAQEIECKIFGFYSERLTWAPYSSSLSCHKKNADFLPDECEGTEPSLGRIDEETGSNGLRTFTLVDTLTMTIMTFEAERPPVVALLCGSEGGMQRAVMCSYDWTTQTFYRETVLRMKTRMLDRTPRMERVRFGLKRWT